MKCISFTFLIDIFEDNHYIECDCFKRNSINVMKNRLLVAKNTRKFQFISTWLSHISKPWELSGLRQTVETHGDLEKYWANDTRVYNLEAFIDVIQLK